MLERRTRPELLLVRHGRSVWNEAGRWQGHADPPLSAAGRDQAVAAASAIPVVERIVSSDLMRARDTARILADAEGTPIEIDVRLRERDIGPWTGLTAAEIDAGWPDHRPSGRVAVGSEDPDSLDTRVAAAVGDLLSSPAGGLTLVVTHAGVLHSIQRTFGSTTLEHSANLHGWVLATGPTGKPMLLGRWAPGDKLLRA